MNFKFHLATLLAIAISRHSPAKVTHLFLQLRTVQIWVGQSHHHYCPRFKSYNKPKCGSLIDFKILIYLPAKAITEVNSFRHLSSHHRKQQCSPRQPDSRGIVGQHLVQV